MSTWLELIREGIREGAVRLWGRFRRSHSFSGTPEAQTDSSPLDASDSSGVATATNRPISVTGTSKSVPAELHASSVEDRGIPYNPSALPASTYPFPERKPVATSSTNTDESFITRASAGGRNITTAPTDASILTAEPGRDTETQTAGDSTETRTDNYAIERQTCTDSPDTNTGNAERSNVSFGNNIPKEPSSFSTTETEVLTKEAEFTNNKANKGANTANVAGPTGMDKGCLPGTGIVSTAEEDTDTVAVAVIRTEKRDEEETEAGDEVEGAADSSTAYPDTPSEPDMNIQSETEPDASVDEEKPAMTTETENSEEADETSTDRDMSAARDTDTDLQDSAKEPESSSRITIPSSPSGFSSSNAGGFSFEKSINIDSPSSTTLTASTAQGAAGDTASAPSSSGDASESPSPSPDLADADIDVEGLMKAAVEATREELSDDVSAPDMGTSADTDSTSSTSEPASPTSALSMVMTNTDNAKDNLQVGHLENLTQNKLTVGAGGTGGSGGGAGGTDGDKTGRGDSGESFTGKRYADKAFLAHLKQSLKKHPAMTAEVLETLCDLYSDYAETEIRADDVTSLFAILQQRGDMKTDDVIYLQTLLWSADQRELFTLVAETANTWERDYEEIVSHLSTSVLDQRDDQLKFLIHKKKEDVTEEVLKEWKTGVAKLMKVPPKHFRIKDVEEDFRGETLVTTETPAVVCEALYKAMDKQDTQEKLEELDVGKVAFEGIQACQQEKVKVVIILQPENQKTWVTAPQCQQDLSEKLRLSLVLGNILTADADVIVTGEDPSLHGYGGVSKTLLEAGGEDFKEEREEVLQAHGGQLSKGSVYITRGVKNFPLVVHAILERRSQTEEEEWTASMAGLYRASVEKSVERGYSRIAIPILGTGAARAPPDKAMRAAIQGLNSVNVPDKRKVQVLLYTKGKEILAVAEAELKKARS